MILNNRELIIRGVPFTESALIQMIKQEQQPDGKGFTAEVYDFIMRWLDDSPVIVVNTSGSTGKPKEMALPKNMMVRSALMSGEVLGLSAGDSALLCLPVTTIAGMMMIVRSFVLRLDLDWVVPSSSPLKDMERDFDFAAMVPMQVKSSLDYLKKLRKLIIGGAPVDVDLQHDLANTSCECYATYGMTECSSHVALQRLNGAEEQGMFQALPGVRFSVTEHQCLVIHAPILGIDELFTHDVVKLYDEISFVVKGRMDNVINSGGVKVHPEMVERVLKEAFKGEIVVTWEADDLLGQRVVLLVEGSGKTFNKAVLINRIKALPGIYDKPREICFIPAFMRTRNGKIRREATRKKWMEIKSSSQGYPL